MRVWLWLCLAQNGQNKVAKMCVRYNADLNLQNVRPHGHASHASYRAYRAYVFAQR
jgi:hypothetical protein